MDNGKGGTTDHTEAMGTQTRNLIVALVKRK